MEINLTNEDIEKRNSFIKTILKDFKTDEEWEQLKTNVQKLKTKYFNPDLKKCSTPGSKIISRTIDTLLLSENEKFVPKYLEDKISKIGKGYNNKNLEYLHYKRNKSAPIIVDRFDWTNSINIQDLKTSLKLLSQKFGDKNNKTKNSNLETGESFRPEPEVVVQRSSQSNKPRVSSLFVRTNRTQMLRKEIAMKNFNVSANFETGNSLNKTKHKKIIKKRLTSRSLKPNKNSSVTSVHSSKKSLVVSSKIIKNQNKDSLNKTKINRPSTNKKFFNVSKSKEQLIKLEMNKNLSVAEESIPQTVNLVAEKNDRLKTKKISTSKTSKTLKNSTNEGNSTLDSNEKFKQSTVKPKRLNSRVKNLINEQNDTVTINNTSKIVKNWKAAICKGEKFEPNPEEREQLKIILNKIKTLIVDLHNKSTSTHCILQADRNVQTEDIVSNGPDEQTLRGEDPFKVIFTPLTLSSIDFKDNDPTTNIKSQNVEEILTCNSSKFMLHDNIDNNCSVTENTFESNGKSEYNLTFENSQENKSYDNVDPFEQIFVDNCFHWIQNIAREYERKDFWENDGATDITLSSNDVALHQTEALQVN